MTVAEGGVKLLPLPATVPKEVNDAIAAAQAAIVAGKIQVDAIGDPAGLADKLKELGYS